MKPFAKLNNSQSLLAKHLNEAIFNRLSGKQTSSGYNFRQAIQSNFDNLDSSIGFYAGDAESYSCFAEIVNPIIEDYHQIRLGAVQVSDYGYGSQEWDMPEYANHYILSTRIRTARNLSGFPFGGGLTPKQRQQVESEIVIALNNLKDSLAGEYSSLAHMSKEQQISLVAQHFLFKQGDRFLDSAGLNNDWPNNRGIFFNADKTFLVWVNEEDQLRIISMEQGGDIRSVFARLAVAVAQLSSSLTFAIDSKLGVLTSCPTNIGTGIRASVHANLPELSKRRDLLDKAADKFHLQIRGKHGEHTASDEPIFDISNKRRLGLTEIECVNDLVVGVRAIIETERSLA